MVLPQDAISLTSPVRTKGNSSQSRTLPVVIASSNLRDVVALSPNFLCFFMFPSMIKENDYNNNKDVDD